jgi:CO/xanthine dehydrogenase FAD-binding subunit
VVPAIQLRETELVPSEILVVSVPDEQGIFAATHFVAQSESMAIVIVAAIAWFKGLNKNNIKGDFNFICQLRDLDLYPLINFS